MKFFLFEGGEGNTIFDLPVKAHDILIKHIPANDHVFSPRRFPYIRLTIKRNFGIMLIFLDIDGVMVPAKSWKSPEILDDGFPAFSNKASRVLQRLVSEETTIVLTTSHKENYTIDEWKSIFKKRDIHIEKIKSLDNNINHLSRKDEILHWFSVNPIQEEFIIIDDDKSLNALPPLIKRNLVLTSSLIGLTDEHLEVIKAISNKGFYVAS